VAEINVTVRKLGFQNVSESSLVAGCGHLDDVSMRLRDGEEHVGLSLHNRVSTSEHHFRGCGEDIITHIEVDGRSPRPTDSVFHVLVIHVSSLIGLACHPDSVARNVSSEFQSFLSHSPFKVEDIVSQVLPFAAKVVSVIKLLEDAAFLIAVIA
jgi:hypothetical protein